jgi:hypothetical protein
MTLLPIAAAVLFIAGILGLSWAYDRWHRIH